MESITALVHMLNPENEVIEWLIDQLSQCLYVRNEFDDITEDFLLQLGDNEKVITAVHSNGYLRALMRILPLLGPEDRPATEDENDGMDHVHEEWKISSAFSAVDLEHTRDLLRECLATEQWPLAKPPLFYLKKTKKRRARPDVSASDSDGTDVKPRRKKAEIGVTKYSHLSKEIVSDSGSDVEELVGEYRKRMQLQLQNSYDEIRAHGDAYDQEVQEVQRLLAKNNHEEDGFQEIDANEHLEVSESDDL